MTLITSVLGWSAFGLGVRCYSLGIQRRFLSENLGGHALFMLGGGVVGYYGHYLLIRQEELLDLQRKRISILNKQKANRLDERLAERASEEGH